MCGRAGEARFHWRTLELGHYGEGFRHRALLDSGPLASERGLAFAFHCSPGPLVWGRWRITTLVLSVAGGQSSSRTLAWVCCL